MNFKNGNKNIGTLENGIFSKNVQASKHLTRIFDAWGMNLDVYKKLPIGTLVRIDDIEDKIRYQIGVEKFVENGIVKDLGAGEQIFLPRKFFVRMDLTTGKVVEPPVMELPKTPNQQTNMFKNIGL